jgi:pyruvate,orthophosphate dikinase
MVTIGDRSFRTGETITIDGGTGEVFAGAVAGASVVVPEAATLQAWAVELGIPFGEAVAPDAVESTAAGRAAETARIGAAADAAIDAAAAAQDGPPPAATADDVLRVLVVKGYATREGVATALLATPEETSHLLEQVVADGLAEMAVGSFRLTPDGRTAGRKRIAADTEHWGLGTALAALDAFLTLDSRMKGTVTAWQVREVDGAQALNDHADAAYDAKVLDDLAALHADASARLRPLVVGLPRLAAYLERLARAAAAARGGDSRFVASPRVDSYHGIWFELHEDLILLAGRNRADEVAAGRA